MAEIASVPPGRAVSVIVDVLIRCINYRVTCRKYIVMTAGYGQKDCF